MVSYSQANKFGQSISIQCTQNQISHFRQFSLQGSAPSFLIKTRRQLRKINFKIIFAPYLGFLTVSPAKLVNWHLSDWQPEHPESNLSNFRQDSLWGSALWFFIKTRFGVRKSDLKVIFAPSLGSLPVS